MMTYDPKKESLNIKCTYVTVDSYTYEILCNYANKLKKIKRKLHKFSNVASQTGKRS